MCFSKINQKVKLSNRTHYPNKRHLRLKNISLAYILKITLQLEFLHSPKVKANMLYIPLWSQRSRWNPDNGRLLTWLISRKAATFTEKILDKEQEDKILYMPFVIWLLSGMVIKILSLPTIWGEKSHEGWVHAFACLSILYFGAQHSACKSRCSMNVYWMNTKIIVERCTKINPLFPHLYF